MIKRSLWLAALVGPFVAASSSFVWGEESCSPAVPDPYRVVVRKKPNGPVSAYCAKIGDSIHIDFSPGFLQSGFNQIGFSTRPTPPNSPTPHLYFLYTCNTNEVTSGNFYNGDLCPTAFTDLRGFKLTLEGTDKDSYELTFRCTIDQWSSALLKSGDHCGFQPNNVSYPGRSMTTLDLTLKRK
jgi:hypothetical protein